jgi:hypothetical protein
MQLRRALVFSLLGGAALVAPGMALGETAAAPAVDLSDLNLRVAECRVVDGIKMGATDLKAPKGEKLVVTTLRGELRTPGKVTVSASTFFTLYSVLTSGNQEKVGKAVGQAVDLSNEGSYAPTATATYTTPKNVLLDVVLTLPDGVDQFYLVYDTAKGKQRVKAIVAKSDPQNHH